MERSDERKLQWRRKELQMREERKLHHAVESSGGERWRRGERWGEGKWSRDERKLHHAAEERRAAEERKLHHAVEI